MRVLTPGPAKYGTAEPPARRCQCRGGASWGLLTSMPRTDFDEVMICHDGPTQTLDLPDPTDFARAGSRSPWVIGPYILRNEKFCHFNRRFAFFSMSDGKNPAKCYFHRNLPFSAQGAYVTQA